MNSSLEYYTPMRSKTNLDKVREFHKTFGSALDVKFNESGISVPVDELIALVTLRLRLLEEEYQEVTNAETPQECLKELADLVYVCYGFAATFGWDLDTAFNRVHESNMSKLAHDGKPIYREDGKVLKGSNYKPASMEGLV